MKVFLVAAACSILMAMAGCSGSDGGQPRGLFTGYVTNKSEEEVTAKFGKPDSVDTSTPNTAKWTYKRKTFEPDTQNHAHLPEGCRRQDEGDAGHLRLSPEHLRRRGP